MAKSPENVAAHFACVKSLIKKHDINDVSRILNLGESGFNLRGMTLGRSKCVVASGTGENMHEPKFRGPCDLVIIKLVISAAGQILTLLVVLPGAEDR